MPFQGHSLQSRLFGSDLLSFYTVMFSNLPFYIIQNFCCLHTDYLSKSILYLNSDKYLVMVFCGGGILAEAISVDLLRFSLYQPYYHYSMHVMWLHMDDNA